MNSFATEHPFILCAVLQLFVIMTIIGLALIGQGERERIRRGDIVRYQNRADLKHFGMLTEVLDVFSNGRFALIRYEQTTQVTLLKDLHPFPQTVLWV